MKFWSNMDDRAGHYRRYEKADLHELLVQCGFEDISIIAVGYPFMALFFRLREKMYRASKEAKKQTSQEASKLANTLVSSINRDVEWSYYRFFPFRLVNFLAKIQRLFYKTDKAMNYVVIANKK
jgi:hypothetical protein